jgi:choline dehydrogenase-like flavoprotein
MPQVIRSPKQYDVCIIGSGAGGGTAAKVLTEGGLNVVMLEAGPALNPETDYKEHLWPYDLPHRGVGVGGKYRGELNDEFLAPNGFWDIDGEPYTSAPGSKFRWFRSRIVGGRTNHWGRIALRFAPVDFKVRSHDGMGDDWPLSYDDVAPYYDKVESYIGVYGTKENVDSAPNGIFMPPPKPRCTDLFIKKVCDKVGVTCIPGRAALITKPLNGRRPCHYCGQCGRGCVTASNFSSSQVMIPPAQATGRLTMITGAMAREITVGKDGKADAVVYIDKATKTEKRLNAKAFVVAASACESARLLLNSRSSASFADGLANSSGAVGRYLTDTVGSSGFGYFPQLEKVPPHNHDGAGTPHMYMPWWKYNKKNDFLRGYHIEFGGGRDMPGVGQFDGVAERYEGYGASFKQRCKQMYGSFIGFAGRGEMIPNERSYCDLDPNVVDQWGIPVLRFHWQWGDNELKMAKDMQETFQQIVESGGGTYFGVERSPDNPYGIADGGVIIHEIGTVRMGSSPKTSVLNQYCQAHDVKNLFVTDGGPFVTNSDKNPTLTIMALSWRASEYLIDQAKKGNL